MRGISTVYPLPVSMMNYWLMSSQSRWTVRVLGAGCRDPQGILTTSAHILQRRKMPRACAVQPREVLLSLGPLEEGLCVQMLHVGPYDAEPVSVARMDAFLRERGFENDFSAERLHHEIYLSDARKVPPEKWRTVIRHPIRRL